MQISLWMRSSLHLSFEIDFFMRRGWVKNKNTRHLLKLQDPKLVETKQPGRKMKTGDFCLCAAAHREVFGKFFIADSVSRLKKENLDFLSFF